MIVDFMHVFFSTDPLTAMMLCNGIFGKCLRLDVSFLTLSTVSTGRAFGLQKSQCHLSLMVLLLTVE